MKALDSGKQREMAATYPRGEESANPSNKVVLNVNLLCLVGACIGVAALFLTWIYEPPTLPAPPDIRYEPTIVYMVTAQYLYYGAAVLFLLGTAASFVSPIGGIAQLSSLWVFAVGIVESGNDPWLDGIDPQQHLRIGMYLGIASCAIILTSLFRPLGTGKFRSAHSKNIRPVERFLTVTLSTS